MLKGEKIGATERFSSVDGRSWDKNSELRQKSLFFPHSLFLKLFQHTTLDGPVGNGLKPFSLQISCPTLKIHAIYTFYSDTVYKLYLFL